MDTTKKELQLYQEKYGDGPYKGKYLVAIDLDNKKAIEEFVDSDTEFRRIKTNSH